MHPIELTWYKVLVLLTAAMAIGFGIYNIVLFNKIRVNKNCNDVTSTQSTTALWLNIFLVIFGAILFLWSFFRLVFPGEMKKELVNKTYNTHYHTTDLNVASPSSSLASENPSNTEYLRPQNVPSIVTSNTSLSSPPLSNSPLLMQSQAPSPMPQTYQQTQMQVNQRY